MATYYVGAGGNDSNDGLSWAQRKLTLNGAEDIPVQAGDTVYVGAGTYADMTCDVSGTAEAGSISYIGDYDGSHTDGTGGVVRITAGTQNILARAINYRTFKGFALLAGTTYSINATNVTNWLLDELYCDSSGVRTMVFDGTCTSNTIQNCYIQIHDYYGIYFGHSSFVSDSSNLIQSCIIVGSSRDAAKAIYTVRYGGIIIKNCLIRNCNIGIQVGTIPDTAQTVTVNNSILFGCKTALYSPTLGFLVENYNNLFNNTTARINTATGANSTALKPNFDARWFFEMVNGGSMVTPFDLASYSELIDVAGTSPTTADMRGTTVQGAQREWGALEYDSTLDIEAGSGGGGGAVSIQPVSGRLGL